MPNPTLPVTELNRIKAPAGQTHVRFDDPIDVSAITQDGGALSSVDATARTAAAAALDRTNHTGTQSADTLTDGTTNKAFLAAERTKLAGIATGATANSSNAVLLARANHTGTQAQSTVVNLVSDLAAKQAADATLAALAGKSLSGAGNVVLQSYVDGLIAGLKFKATVRVATLTNGSLSTAFANGSFVDGIPLVTGNRILLKNQTSAAANGIYTVNASGPPSRATDFAEWAEIPGALVAVEVGTANADTVWLCVSDSGGTLDTTAINLTRFGAGSLLAANNLSDVASRNAAANNLLPAQTAAAAKVLTSDGTDAAWQAPAGSGDVTAAATVRGYTVGPTIDFAAIIVLDYAVFFGAGTLTIDAVDTAIPEGTGAGVRPDVGDMPAISGWTLDDPGASAWRYTCNTYGSHAVSMNTTPGAPVTMSFTNGSVEAPASGEIASAPVVVAVSGKKISRVSAYLNVTGDLGGNAVAVFHSASGMQTQITEARTSSGLFAITHEAGIVGGAPGESLLLKFTGAVAAPGDPPNQAAVDVSCRQA